MKRNVWFGLIVGCAGCMMLLMLVGAAGAQAGHLGSPAASSAAFTAITSTQLLGLQPQSGGVTQSPEAVTAIQPAGSAFTYQGQLKSDGSPVNGNCDMAFSLWAKRISPSIKYLQVGSTLTETNVGVANGLFNVSLDFGDGDGIFSGDARYLDISVSCPAGSGSYTDLGRQPLTAVPYALGLVPGAVIHGTAYQNLKVMSDAPTGGIPAAVTAEVYNALDGIGLFGVNYTSSPTGTGVFGQQGSGIPTASYYGGVVGSSTLAGGIGVVGEADSITGIGVYGVSSDYGVYGDTIAGTGVYGNSGFGYGVHGESNSGRGVYGTSDAGVGVYGTGPTGTMGIASTITGTGVSGTSNEGWGVFGHSRSNNGVFGHSATGTGVFGSSDDSFGVEGASTNGTGVLANSYAGTAVVAVAINGDALYGVTNLSGYAGHFDGNVFVNGNLSATGVKAFKIDNPLDPAKQYLYHYAVESPQVENMYNGTATLDAKGEAVVTLPAYFSAINSGEFQYQLTAIGAPMPNLYVAEEITDNHFQIAGGVAGKKVSWTVFGQRNDPWLRDHPQTDVVDKPAKEAGTYLYPEGYGRPVTAGLDYTQTHRLEPNVQSTAPTGQP